MYCRYNTGEERERQNNYNGWTYRLNLDLKWEWWLEAEAKWVTYWNQKITLKDLIRKKELIVSYKDTWAEPFEGMED